MADNALLELLRNLGSAKEIKAEAIAALFLAFTGERPTLEKGRDDFGEFIRIKFSERQLEALRLNLDTLINKEPGDVRMDLAPVFTPLIIKKGLPYILGAGALGAIGGRYLK